MPIKLLSKQEINQRQVTQKRAEVDQGRKLATRVDTLRELAAQEEASLASFRAKMVKSINDETLTAIEERNVLQTQVKTLREEIETGLKPVIKAESQLKSKIQTLDKQENQIKQRIELIRKKEEEIKIDFHKIHSLHSRLKYVETQINDAKILIEEQLDMAEIVLENAELKKNQVDAMEKSIKEELHDKDINVASRERDITIKEERVQKQFKVLEERELHLIDREQTLEREFNRLKK